MVFQKYVTLLKLPQFVECEKIYCWYEIYIWLLISMVNIVQDDDWCQLLIH